jgi:triacylglycerol lipase
MKYIVTAISLLIAAPAFASDCVILLHGLARSATSLFVMETGLDGIGYTVVNVNYASDKGTIEQQAMSEIPKAIATCGDTRTVNFVTHSMGGIMVRYYLETTKQRPENLGRVVMLAPPNKGTPIVDQLADISGFEWWNGVAGKQLGTGPDSLPNRLGPVDYPVGVIAGNESILPVFSGLFKGVNDGKVSVESTKVDGMADHIVLPVTHTFMMNSPAVFKQVANFLREGRFKHEE